MALGVWLTSLLTKAKASEPKFARVEDLRADVIRKLKLACPSAESIVLDSTDPARFSFVLRDQLNSGNVTNLFCYINAYTEEKNELLIEKFVRTLSFDGEFLSDNLVTLIRTRDFVDQLEVVPNKAIFTPLVGDLVACSMVDMPDSIVTTSLDHFPGKSEAQLLELGTVNLRKWLPNLAYDRSINPIILYYIEGNPMLTSGLLITSEFWSGLNAHFSEDVFVAIPRRDQVFLLDGRRADAIPAMRKLIELTFQDNFNLLSSHLYRHRNGELEVAEE